MIKKPEIRLVNEESNSGAFTGYFELAGPAHRSIASEDESHCCDFSADGRLFAWSCGNGFVKVVEYDITKNGNRNSSPWSQTIDCAKNVNVMKFVGENYMRDANDNLPYLLATGLDNGRIKIWNAILNTMVLNLSDHNHRITGLSFAAFGEPLLVSCSMDKTLKIWDLADDGNMTLTMKGHHLPILDCAFSPTDPTIICSVGRGKSVIIWKLKNKRSYELTLHLRGHYNDVVSCAWSPDGAVVATASHDTSVMVWDPILGHALLNLGHVNPPPEPIYAGGANGSWVKSVDFSPDGCHIVTLCEDDKLRIWSLWSGDEISTRSMPKPGYCCKFSPSGNAVAVGKSDGSASVPCLGVEIMSLCHLSRLALRRNLSSNSLQSMKLPTQIKKYLLYQSELTL